MAITVKPRIGVSGFVYTPLTESSDVIGGTPSYGSIYSIPGTVKIGIKVNGKPETAFGDNVALMIAETVGKIDVSLDLLDIPPADLARLLGHTMANGMTAHTGVDISPYVAIGFKVLRSGLDNSGAVAAYDYFWFYKGKFAKGDVGGDTKADSIKWQNQSLVGQFAALISNTQIRGWLRTDDPAISAAFQAAFFSQVTFMSSDLTALTMAITTGVGATKTLLLTFSKASNSGSIPFTIPAATIAALASQLILLTTAAGVLVPFTAALLSAGTGFSNSPITVTLTTTLAATAVYAAIDAGSPIIDASGVSVTAYQSGSVTTHA